MSFVLAILAHTPAPVWIGLAVLVVLGLSQLRDRTIPAARVVVVPAVIGVLSALSVAHLFPGVGAELTLLAWAVGAGLGLAANRVLDLPRGARALPGGRFHVPGSAAPLALMLAIFGLRYALGVSLALQPARGADPVFAALASLACGVPAGLFVARARKVWATRREAGIGLAAA